MNAARIITVVVSISLADSAHAQTCPEPPNKVLFNAVAAVVFDPVTELYTYSYTVTNSPSSGQEISDFAIDFIGRISAVRSPRGWRHRFMSDVGTTRNQGAIRWHAYENAPEDPNQPDTGGTLPGLYQIKPGQTLGGFEFKSPDPPFTINSYALGYVDVPTTSSELEAELQVENCPDTAGDFFSVAAVGVTLGPIQLFDSEFVTLAGPPDPNTRTSAPKITGTTPQAVVEPATPEDRTVSTVILFGTPQFAGEAVKPDTLKINGQTLKDIHGEYHVEDANRDGRTDIVIHTNIREAELQGALTARTLAGVGIRATRRQ